MAAFSKTRGGAGQLELGPFLGQNRKALRSSAVLMAETKKAGVRGALNTLWAMTGKKRPNRSNFPPPRSHFAEQCLARCAQAGRHQTPDPWGSAAARPMKPSKPRLAWIFSAPPGMTGLRIPPRPCFTTTCCKRLYASHAKDWDLQGAYRAGPRP